MEVRIYFVFVRANNNVWSKYMDVMLLDPRVAMGSDNQTISGRAQVGATMPKSKLLIVDDDPVKMEILCGHLEPAGYTTCCFPSAADALATLREETFDLVLIDLHLSEMGGIK